MIIIIIITKFPIPLSHCNSMIFSRSQHTLFTLCYSDKTIIITQSHSSIVPTCFTSSLEPGPYINQNCSSELLIPS